MKEADFQRREGDRIRCLLCPHRCLLKEGQTGICNVRRVENGRLHTLAYGMAAALHVDPIEKKPLFHFLPGSLSLSVGTVGCNLHCLFCQNWTLSLMSDNLDKHAATQYISPESIVASALKHHCRSIAFTYSEPTIFYEYARDIAVQSANRGLSNIFVTNGYIESEPLLALKGVLHAANVDLKTFRDHTYREIMGGTLSPVLENVKRMKHDLKLWLEVTTLVIPTINDSEAELKDIATFIKQELGADVPWHVSRFHPDYQMTHLPPTPVATLQRAREIGMEMGLHYVYTGNAPGNPGETTYCPECTHPLIKRQGFTIKRNSVTGGTCNKCGAAISGVWPKE